MQLMIYIQYRPFFKNGKLKYVASSQRTSFNSFSLIYIFFPDRFLFYHLFPNSHAQRNITAIIYPGKVYLFRLMNR